jgi:hypothetical protein
LTIDDNYPLLHAPSLLDHTLLKGSRTAWQLIGLVAMIGLILAIFVLFVDVRVVGQQLRAAEPRYLLAASVSLLVGLGAYARRWRLLLGNKPDLLPTFHASNIGHAGNILLPARAGEAARIVAMGRSDAVTVAEATSSFVVERLFEQIMRLVVLAGAVVYGVGLQLSAGTIAGGIIFLALAFAGIAWLVGHQQIALAKGPLWLARLPRVTEAGARQSLADLLTNLVNIAAPRQLALVVLWSAIPWLCFGGFFYLALLALPAGFPPHERLAISLGALALSPPSAPTQPGVFHASVVAPLAAIGFNSEALTAYAVLLHGLEMVWMIGLALWGLTQMGFSRAQSEIN